AIHATSEIDFARYAGCIQKMANVSTVSFVNGKQDGATSFLVGKDEFYVTIAESIDVEAERERITKEIEYLQGVLKSVNAKLANERFVQNAKPEIVAHERNKKADAEATIEFLHKNPARLSQPGQHWRSQTASRSRVYDAGSSSYAFTSLRSYSATNSAPVGCRPQSRPRRCRRVSAI